ncbi:MAG: hypothetical protein GFH27_549283n274 [Chloroflexi bacterium AL-W]|nr:hypothetical protein [Chloroflexi bacterium AL-N1]NOK64605.1 hypothetical protein [Chloroflexi bacterium AL-N10]NOK75846.1 hypothetical protein [Chloroflexi bacterium AL-N5]NOK80395.1 hypothetical protein [Chloroflexi bacterium AL-W]NOK86909.1 hypothetical protein [Chloroflexi bacterium AL-N15]
MSTRAEQINALTPGKRELLARLLLKRGNQGADTRRIPRRGADDPFLLSFVQERIWFMEQLIPGTAAYNMAGATYITGPLNEAAVFHTLNEIIRRHDALRTAFQMVDGQSVMELSAELTLPPRIEDLRALPEAEREAAAQQLVTQDVQRPFDLSQPPLLRFLLIRLDDEKYIGCLTSHHIVSDGVSTRVIFQEFAAMYPAFAAGQPAPLPELPIQYADYALWQRNWLQGDVLEAQLAFWRKQFSDDIPVLDLPIDHPRPATPTFHGGRLPLAIAPATAQAVGAFSQQERVTHFMVLLTAFKTLLYRYSGQADLVVGIPVAGRNQPELEVLIGCFLNMLPLRTILSDNPTFRDCVSRVQSVALSAYDHQDLPFEKLVNELQPDRTMSHAPLTQVAFSFEDNPTSALHIQDLLITFDEVSTEAAKLDLALELNETHANGAIELTGWFDYNAEVFEAVTMEHMAIHLQRILESVLEHPERHIADISLLTEAEQQQILVDWNGLTADYPLDQCVHHAFEQQVVQTPNNIAVWFEDQTLTYQELNRRANQVAHYLQKRGIGPEELVGLCLERSPEMIISVLGVLKAGGAYVPLDPSHPEDRLAFIVNNAQGSVLITQERFVSRFPQDTALHIVCVDRDASLLASESAANPPSAVCADNLAYVLYTSGSTGKPKGVTVQHRDLLHHTKVFIDVQHMTTSDRMLMFVSLIFDAAAAALYPPLLCGASIALPAVASSEMSGGEFTAICEQYGVTIIHLPAAFWHQWVDALEASNASVGFPLRVMMTGGEVPSLEKLATFTRLLDRPLKFFNAYGPTEAVITITLYEIDCHKEALEQLVRMPSGRPIANKHMYLLDAHLNPVPIGVHGQVYIGGIGQARDYLNDPHLTATKFIPDPFSTLAGKRLYATGDLARYLPDGNIEFISRIDQQVKIRGLRIELGEVETTLSHHHDVLENVVITRKDLSGNKRIVAYIEPRSDTALTSSDLRAFLESHLPEYMIPSAFVFLDHIPLTTLGKVNQRALPEPDWDRFTITNAYVAPRTPVERSLTQLWRQVIGVEQVGVDDNFFQLGGHSLLAAQLIARVREAFQIDLPMRSLFETPTVAGLAMTIGQLKAEHGHTSHVVATVPTIEPAIDQRSEPFPLNDVQQAYWIGRSDMLDLGNVSCHGYVEVDCVNLDLPRLNRAWQRLIERHDMLRAFIRSDGQQQILAEVPFYEMDVIDLRTDDPQSTENRLADIRDHMSHQVIDCYQWPLFEIKAARLDEHRYRLFASVDLLIADAWSFSILLQELEQFFQHADAELPQLDLSFRDYVLGEKALVETELYRRSMTYWQNRLDTLPPGPDLPLAKPPQSVVQPQFVRRSSRLDADAWAALKDKASQLGLTPSGVLLAAYAEVLTAWSKSPHMTINLTLFNRLPLHPQVNEVFGDFTSITLLEVNNTLSEEFHVRARHIQEQLWEDLDHRYVSGVAVQRELMRHRGGAAASAMPVVFTSTLTSGGQDARSSLAWLGEMVYAIGQTPQVWLDHVVAEAAGALVFNWDTVEELFPAGMIDDMFESYCTLLQQLVEDDTIWNATVLNLTPPTQCAQQAHINATEAPIPTGLLHTPFVTQAQQHPQQPAIITPDHVLSYDQVYRHANQIGRYLRERGVQPNTLVAIVMEKGWEQIVAALGILNAGAAYLPIDASVPPERLHYLLEHGQVSLVLTQSWVAPHLVWPNTVEHFVVDSEVFTTLSDQLLVPIQQPDDLAYVIYTSGSTGLPKGVVIDHRGALNTIVDINERFAVGPNDRVLALSSLNFDLSVYDIFGLLAVGGAVVMPSAEAQREPSHWSELLESTQVTIWNTVPALMGMQVEYTSGRNEPLPSSLRLVMMSGDWIPLTLPDAIRRLQPDIEIYSLGGATEASIWSILYPIEAVDPVWPSIPYGRPMLNQTFHVLDHQLESRPTWVPGDLYIGGIGLAKGYWCDDEKTASSFITHPRTGARLYRTGDMGRYLPAGDIEFLGRQDFQVKVQGYRIELGEIESVLSQHPAIQSSVVTALGERHGNKRLVGYVVAQEQVDIDDMRAFLKDKLPEYMVPSAFVVLERLPLTANGKVDRRALPSPEDGGVEVERPYVAPRTMAEQTLAEICTRVLGVTQVGIHDNFFELGGNSIQATQLVSLLRESFQIELPLRSIFEVPSVIALAERIEAIQWSQQPAKVLVVDGDDREEGEL